MNQVTLDTEKNRIAIDGVELQAVKKIRFEQSEMSGVAEITVTFDARVITQSVNTPERR